MKLSNKNLLKLYQAIQHTSDYIKHIAITDFTDYINKHNYNYEIIAKSDDFVLVKCWTTEALNKAINNLNAQKLKYIINRLDAPYTIKQLLTKNYKNIDPILILEAH